MFANDIVRALLAVRRQVAVGEVVEGQALVAGKFSTLENREREARQSTHVDLVGRQARGGTDRIVVRKFDLKELLTTIVSIWPIVWHTRSTPPVAVWVVGAGRKFSNPEKLVNGVRELGAELEPVVRDDAARAPPDGHITIDEDIGRALGGELCGCDGIHVGSAAEAISEEQDVGIS